MKDKYQKRTKRLLQWAGTIITILALIFIASQQGWGEILSAISQISIKHLCGAILVMFCSRLAITMRFHVLVKTIESKVSFADMARITFAGLFASNFLPSTIGGDLIRFAGLIHYSVDSATSAAALLFDRLIGMIGMAFMLPFAGKLTIKEIFKQFAHRPVLVYGFLGKFKTKNLFKKFRAWVAKALEACSLWYQHPTAILKAFFFTGVHMLSLFGALFFLVSGLGDSLPFWKLGAYWSIVYFITLVPISINGYGLQEISVAFVLTQWGGISSPHSIVVALIMRLLLVLASLPGALFLPKIIADLDHWR